MDLQRPEYPSLGFGARVAYAGGVITYMIRHEEPVDGFTEPMPDATKWEETFRPPEGFDTEISEPPFTRLRRGDTSIDIESSGIGVGIQVTFQGPIDDGEADRIVSSFVQGVSEALDAPVASVRLPEGKIIRWTR